jgi:hypothetical protein
MTLVLFIHLPLVFPHVGFARCRGHWRFALSAARAQSDESDDTCAAE